MRVLVADDSILMRNILKDFFERTDSQIVGEAPNGRVALDLAERVQPDLIMMDIDMPIMDGLEATMELMKRHPVPVVIFSTGITDPISSSAYKAGAADVIEKPVLDRFYDTAYTTELLRRLEGCVSRPQNQSGESAVSRKELDRPPRRAEAIVIGASTGGPIAVKTILDALPPDFPVGIAVVQHIEARFSGGYARWLDTGCALDVRPAKESAPFVAGTVTVAPGDRHLVVANRALTLDDGPKIGSHRPAVDRLFSTAAESFGGTLVGVLLTGMGRDGADGCLAIRKAGGYTIVQDEQTSFIYGMPKAAAEIGGASVIKPLDAIAGILKEIAGCD